MGDKIAKVSLNGETLIDISEDSVTPEVLARDETAHDAAGEPIRGTAEFGGDTTDCYKTTDPASTDLADTDYIPFNDVSDSETPKKKTLFSNIKEKLKSLFSWFITQGDGIQMVWNAKIENFWAQIKVNKTTGKMKFNWSEDGGSTWHGDVALQNDLGIGTNDYTFLRKDGSWKVPLLNEFKEINNVDLNDLGPGYYLSVWANYSNITNHPPFEDAYMYFIIRPNLDTYTKQIAIARGTNIIYTRTKTTASTPWTDWVEMATTDDIPNLQDKTHYLDSVLNTDHQILYSDDLNDYTSTGTYQYNYNSNGLPANCPLSVNVSFKLIVDRYSSSANSEIMQRITMQNLNNGKEMDWYRVRNWAQSTWNPWYQVAARSDLPPAIAVTGKNLIPTWCRTTNTYTNNGITYTLNPADGSITASGTASADSSCILWRTADQYYLPKGRYLLSGCPNGGSESTYMICFQIKRDGLSEVNYKDYGSSSVIDLSVDARNSSTSNYYISIKSGQTVSNLVFKPMIRPEWTSDTYEPNENIHKGNMYVGSCATAAATKDKEAFVDGYFVLRVGVRVAIKYSNTNTFNSQPSTPITLNVNGTGAKQIWYNAGATGSSSGAPTGTANYIFGQAGRYIYYVYDGNYWCWDGHGLDNNNTNFVRNDASSTITGAAGLTLSLKGTDVDAQTADNGVSAVKYMSLNNVCDKNGLIMTRDESIIYPNGNIAHFWYVRNYNGSTSHVGQKGISAIMDKSGTVTWVIGDEDNFRKAIKTIDQYGTDIPDNANLNDYKNPGTYNVTTNARAATITNIPVTVAGKLVVLNVADDSYRIQFYILYSNSEERYIFIRHWNTNAWSRWNTFPIAFSNNLVDDTSGDIQIRVHPSGTKHAFGFKVRASDLALVFNACNASASWLGDHVVYTDHTPPVLYCKCETAAATAAKVATPVKSTSKLRGLRYGQIVAVTFTNSNTASNVTLNVDGSGAKTIYYDGGAYTGNNQNICGLANRTTYYMWDGTYWRYITINRIIDSDIRPTAYCDTAAGTAAKTAVCTNYKLLSNSYIMVLIVNSNSSASALTLNINGQGAKAIYINGVASSTTNYSLPAGTYFVFYDGTNYYFRTDGLLRGNTVNLCTNSSTQISWSTTMVNACTSISNGAAWFYLQSDHLLYASVECTYKGSTGATLPSYSTSTDTVLFRFENSRLNRFNNIYSEVMVDINGTIYPAFASPGQTINSKNCLVVALRKNATLPTGDGNIRFTFTVMCNYN